MLNRNRFIAAKVAADKVAKKLPAPPREVERSNTRPYRLTKKERDEFKDELVCLVCSLTEKSE